MTAERPVELDGQAAGPAAVARLTAVDLFAGTAGATAAFRRAGWRVVAVDLVRSCRPTVVADVRALPLSGETPIDLLWASPPCTEFSDANPGRPPRPSLDLVMATFDAVRWLRPMFWVMENVRGAIPWLGVPVQKVGPWCLWGYFPPLRVSWAAGTYRKAPHRSAVARAAIPFEVSAALLEAVELYTGCPSLLDLRPFRRHRHRAARRGAAEPGLGL